MTRVGSQSHKKKIDCINRQCYDVYFCDINLHLLVIIKIIKDARYVCIKKGNVYLPSLRMKVLDHVYVLGHSYTCHTLIKYNRYA
jgi:hypothetical protein